ncbi:MAG: zinc-ribbon domain-containing protein [Gemmatimonadetes bacterium]|nr:zinc-ribbon domain-containing protein [Gemmatimonadota bacterium]
MNVTCPRCRTVFRVDPAKVPAGGVRARCAICGNPFQVGLAAPAPAMEPATVAAPAPAAAPPPIVEAPPALAPTAARPADASALPAAAPPPAPPPAPAGAARPAFAQTDPDARARRLARALVSDLVTYQPDLQGRGLREGRLKELFWQEIKKSWQEYVRQVGLEKAQKTPYFRDALNEILAKGQKVF